ncbi:MAG: hypothetical protein ACPF9L_04765 [Candidatus Poseidoniaceae archaeon]
MMDANMKNMMMTALAALSMILGIVGAMGGTWLVPTGDDAEAMEEMDMDVGYGLTSVWTTMDAGDADTCDAMAEMMDDGTGEVECDGAELTMTSSFSDICDDDDDDDACDMATGGMIGTIGMWAGIICALVLTLTLALPMAGVDAMDNLPDMAKTITMWGAGALMLVGMLGWYIMLPDTDSETGLGMSGWLAGAAMTMGLGAAATSQFIEADE